MVGLHGSEDPTKASLPFLFAGGAIEAGHQPTIILTGDAVVLMHDEVVNTVQGIGLPPFKDRLKKVVDNKVPIYV